MAAGLGHTHAAADPTRLRALLRLVAVYPRRGLKAIQELLPWLSTTTLYVHVHNEHIEQAWNQANQRVTTRLIEDDAMQWNPWMKAAERGIWKSVEMRRLLAEAGDQRGQDVDALDNHPDHDQARGPRRDLHRAGVHSATCSL